MKFTTALTILTLIATAPLLSACNTAAGMGQDISNTGQWITHDVTPTPKPMTVTKHHKDRYCHHSKPVHATVPRDDTTLANPG